MFKISDTLKLNTGILSEDFSKDNGLPIPNQIAPNQVNPNQSKPTTQQSSNVEQSNFDNGVKKMDGNSKLKLHEMVLKFNEYGRILHEIDRIKTVAEDLLAISELAESYALNESGDWFDQNVIKMDMKEIKKIAADFNKISKECYVNNKKLVAQYENMGHRLGRYFEIKD